MIPRHSIALLAVTVGYGAPRPLSLDRRCDFDPGPDAAAYGTTWMVAKARVVLRARADSSILFDPSDPRTGYGPNGRVFLTVLEVLDSGRLAIPHSLALPGFLEDSADFNPGAVPYRSARPEAMHGTCWAKRYQRGGEFLLLLRGNTVDSLTPYWAELLPTNEQIHGANDPWVSWVRGFRTGLAANRPGG